MLLGRLLKALLALTLVAAPVVRDACVFLCQTPTHASAASPSCHHAGTAGTAAGAHLRPLAAPCEHGSGPHDNRITAREESRRDGLAVRASAVFVLNTSLNLAASAHPHSLIPDPFRNPFREVPLRI